MAIGDEPFEPKPLLESTLQLMNSRVSGRPVVLVADFADDVPASCVAIRAVSGKSLLTY